MAMRRASKGAACLLAAMIAGCASPPADYAAQLSRQDPKWRSPECQQIRAAAVNYQAGEKKTIGVATGMLLGPYGVGIALAGKDNRDKKRALFNREMHLRCSSKPLPPGLQIDPAALR